MSKVTVREPLVTGRLVLRPLDEHDLDDVFAYQSMPEVVEFMFWEVRTRDQSREHLARRSTLSTLENDGDVLVLAVVLPGEPRLVGASAGAGGSGTGTGTGTNDTETPGRGTTGRGTTGRVIGDITVFLRSTANRHVELGWVLHPDFQGKGFASEAAGRMLDFAFTELGAHRVSADLDPRNESSAALARRLGMRQEAHFREDIFTKGAFADTAIFAVLRSEWSERRGSSGTVGAFDATRGLPPIRVAALVLIRERHLLMVTARGRDVLYLPGGKIDAGETPVEAVLRESREEVALELDEQSIRSLFTVRTQAHGEPEGRMVEMSLFEATSAGEPVPSAEVDAVHWVTSADALRCPPAGVETLRRLVQLDLID